MKNYWLAVTVEENGKYASFCVMDKRFYNQQRRLMRCETCGEIVTVTKRPNRKTPVGHVKHMYCYRCRRRTKHIQIGEV